MDAIEQSIGASLRTQPDILFTLPDRRIDRQVELIPFYIIVASPCIDILRPRLSCIQSRKGREEIRATLAVAAR